MPFLCGFCNIFTLFLSLFQRKSRERKQFLDYWKQFGTDANINSMMLNVSASIFEEKDREEVCLMLPDFTGKKVLEVGAGIGRFTTELTKSAGSTYSSDFLPQFVDKLKLIEKKLKKRKIKLTVSVNDATLLKYPMESFYLVFTNWILMYMNDYEFVQFSYDVLKWLEIGGYFKFRESCSEPSTLNFDNIYETQLNGEKKPNPSIYRISSVYIKLFEHIQYKDKKKRKWKYEVEICAPVQTYISYGNNWRQVQMRLKKIEGNNFDKYYSLEELVNLVTHDWVNEQKDTDIRVNNVKEYFSDDIFKEYIDISENDGNNVYRKKGVTLLFQSPYNSWFKRIYPFNLKTSQDQIIWTNESNPELFRCLLTAANIEKNTNIFVSYAKNNIFSILEYIKMKDALLNNFFAIDFLENHELNFIPKFIDIKNSKSKIVLLESFNSEEERQNKLTKIERNYQIRDVTGKVHNSVNSLSYIENIQQDLTLKNWMLIVINFD